MRKWPRGEIKRQGQRGRCVWVGPSPAHVTLWVIRTLLFFYSEWDRKPEDLEQKLMWSDLFNWIIPVAVVKIDRRLADAKAKKLVKRLLPKVGQRWWWLSPGWYWWKEWQMIEFCIYLEDKGFMWENVGVWEKGMWGCERKKEIRASSVKR